MIVVDTSALLAVLQNEPGYETIIATLAGAGRLAMSAGTLAETLIVARRRDRGVAMERSIVELGIIIHPVTAAFAGAVADAYDRWGMGVNRAGLNLGDCFAYALARELGCPLAFVGNDFSETDIQPAL